MGYLILARETDIKVFTMQDLGFYLLSCYTDPVDPRMPDEKEKGKAADQSCVDTRSYRPSYR